MDIGANTIFLAFIGGVVPALLWLWFWIKEDFKHPEPTRLIFAAFVSGMFVVPIALALEKIADAKIDSIIVLFVFWAAIEEFLKYGAAYVIAFRKACIDKSRCIHDTMDPIIYLITTALGFSALENTLFLIDPLSRGEVWESLQTGNLRFVGATVLHVAASASIGIAMGLSFYKRPEYKKLYLYGGIFTAIMLHALFNISIIKGSGNLFFTFGALWLVMLILIALFEKVKKNWINKGH